MCHAKGMWAEYRQLSILASGWLAQGPPACLLLATKNVETRKCIHTIPAAFESDPAGVRTPYSRVAYASKCAPYTTRPTGRLKQNLDR